MDSTRLVCAIPILAAPTLLLPRPDPRLRSVDRHALLRALLPPRRPPLFAAHPRVQADHARAHLHPQGHAERIVRPRGLDCHHRAIEEMGEHLLVRAVVPTAALGRVAEARHVAPLAHKSRANRARAEGEPRAFLLRAGGGGGEHARLGAGRRGHPRRNRRPHAAAAAASGAHRQRRDGGRGRGARGVYGVAALMGLQRRREEGAPLAAALAAARLLAA